jgi:hypothetical protein|tara:strand:- start:1204 stop:1368 length:165 start_codon:yes stop_codon:yes gene_type:complete
MALIFYTAVHVCKGQQIVQAETTLQAAQKAAAYWRLKTTAGIDVYRHDTEIVLT